jgi:hypothetical protein
MKKETSKVIKIKEKKETYRKESNRMFASFQNRAHQDETFLDLHSRIQKRSKTLAWELMVFFQMLDSTIAEGYTDDQE